MQRAAPSSLFEWKGIGSLLKVGRLRVPVNQREYSWEEKQVNDLFQDFSQAIRKRQSTYFLGTIVVSKGTKNVPEVVDGQQRLATTTILLAAFRDYFFNKNENMLQTSIDNDFLFTIDRVSREKVPKLSLNIDDNEYFRNRIVALPKSNERISVQEKKESHKRISFAAQKAEELVQDIVKGYNDRNRNEILNDWLEFIENRATIILLTVPDEMNAFMMFETLNDRGLKTSQADLVKNYLFAEADDRLPEAQQKWSKMVSTLETLGIDDIVMTYLRHLVITLFGPTREKDIFTKIHSEVSGKTQSVTFLDQLADYADSYAAIVTPSHPKWNSYPPQIPDAINVFRDLRVQQIRPLMLAVAQHFDPKEADIAFRSFICWTVRFLISGGMRGGQLEEAYASKAHDVAKGNIRTTKDLLRTLSNTIPTDGEFRAAFSTARVSQHYLARYYLRAIEAHLRKETDQPELKPVQDITIVNLEHILPQELSSNWPHIDPETAEVYTKRIGNLTLMRSRANADFGNAAFQSKRAEFRSSQMLLNKHIYDSTDEKTEWGPNEISERQKKLAEFAINTWPLAPKSVQTKF
jgi:uncharacterized protein with ParB-like and HNH nuclease domain